MSDDGDDMNLRMILVAIARKKRIQVIPRRTHGITGIPVLLERDTRRLYIESEGKVQSILLSEIAHFTFPSSLFKEVDKTRSEKALGKPFRGGYGPPPEKEDTAEVKTE